MAEPAKEAMIAIAAEPRSDDKGHLFAQARDGQCCLLCFTPRSTETERDVCPSRIRGE